MHMRILVRIAVIVAFEAKQAVHYIQMQLNISSETPPPNGVERSKIFLPERLTAPLVAMQSIATAQVEIFLKKVKSTLYWGGKATKAIALHTLTGWTT